MNYIPIGKSLQLDFDGIDLQRLDSQLKGSICIEFTSDTSVIAA